MGRPKPNTNVRAIIKELLLRDGPNLDPVREGLNVARDLHHIDSCRLQPWYLQKWPAVPATGSSAGPTTGPTSSSASASAPAPTPARVSVPAVVSPHTASLPPVVLSTENSVAISRKRNDKYDQASPSRSVRGAQLFSDILGSSKGPSPKRSRQSEEAVSPRAPHSGSLTPAGQENTDLPVSNSLHASEKASGVNDGWMPNEDDDHYDNAAAAEKKAEQNRSANEVEYNNEVEDELELIDDIFMTAREDRSKLQASVATELAAILRYKFGGFDGLLHKSEIINGPADCDVSVEMQRRGLATLMTGQWVHDDVIDALLMSYYPSNKVNNDTQIANVDEFNRCMASDEALLDDPLSLPTPQLLLQLTDDTDKLIAIANLGRAHWIVIRAIRRTGTIEIYDSLPYLENGVLSGRARRLQAQVLLVVRYLCVSADMGGLWYSLSGPYSWTCTWRATYHQRNSYDCGIHAVRNTLDLARTGTVLPYHSAATLRYHFACRIGELLSGELKCGNDIGLPPMMTPPSQPTAQSSSNVNTASESERYMEALHIASTQHVRPHEDEPLTGSIPPFRYSDRKEMSYRNCIISLLKAAGPQGLPLAELKLRYGRFSRQLNRRLCNGWQYKLEFAMNKRQGGFVRKDDETGNVTLIDYYNQHVDPRADQYYGSAMSRAFERAQDFRDDIDRRARAIILPVRNSDDTSSGDLIPNEDFALNGIGLKNLDYYLSVFPGRVRRPTEILKVADLGLPEDDPYEFHVFKQVRASHCEVFTRNNGQQSEADRELLAILDKLEEEAAQKPNKDLIIFPVFAVDGWFTHRGSWEILSRPFPHLELRISMLMPTERVDDMPHVFKPRNPPDSTYDVAWAHLDVSLMADLASRLAQDPMDPVLDRSADHTSMLYVFETVEDWKLEAHLAPRDDGTEKRIRQQAHPHGERLMRGLQRHATIRPPPIPLRCCICDGQAIQVWKRGPTNEVDVVCDREDCLASLLESEGAGDGNGDDTANRDKPEPTEGRSKRSADHIEDPADEPPAKKSKRRTKSEARLDAEANAQCSTCHTRSSPKWINDGHDGLVCNACYQKHKKRDQVSENSRERCPSCEKTKVLSCGPEERKVCRGCHDRAKKRREAQEE